MNFLKKKFSKNKFKEFFLFKSRFKKLNLFKYYINIPSYIEINFRIMSAILIKRPFSEEVNFPFKIKKRTRKFSLKKRTFLRRFKSLKTISLRKCEKKIIFKRLKIPSLSNKF